MKKVTLTDLNGKEIEVYFADDKTVEGVTHNDKYDVKVEDVPLNKDWFDMTGGEETIYSLAPAGSAWEGNQYEKLSSAFSNKAKQLEESKSQISIDDTIPSDFVEERDLRLGGIYKAAGLNLLAKFAGSFVTTVPDGNKVLLQMKRHGTVFYVEEGSLLKATDSEVRQYLGLSPYESKY